jgi:hypothetical protein
MPKRCPIVWPSKRFSGVNREDRTMTSFQRLSVLKVITISAALSMTAGFALAGDTVSADQIIHALQPKPLTRGLSAGPQVDPTVKAAWTDAVSYRAGRTRYPARADRGWLP